ncbi:MAG: hypothetical protein AAGD00_08400 [Planctomycetota bacterium]
MHDARLLDVQKRKPFVIWAVIVFVSAMGWGLFFRQLMQGQPVGSNPAPDWLAWILWAVLGVASPIFFQIFRVRTRLEGESLAVNVLPIWTRWIPLEQIESVEVAEYRPIVDYLGWGIRYVPGRGWGYFVGGTRGVKLRLREHQPVLIGASDPDGLAGEIEAARGANISASSPT